MPSFTDKGLVVIQAIVGRDQNHRDFCHRYQERCPADQTAPALIDTGAEVCVVDLSILSKLFIQPHDKRNLNGVNGDSVLRDIFSVSLQIVSKDGTVLIDKPNHEVFGVDFPASSDYKAILGMDVLCSFTLMLNHKQKWVRLCQTTDATEPL